MIPLILSSQTGKMNPWEKMPEQSCLGKEDDDRDGAQGDISGVMKNPDKAADNIGAKIHRTGHVRPVHSIECKSNLNEKGKTQ